MSAQKTKLYIIEEIIVKQIISIVNFPPRQVANILSDVLVLGSDSEQGIVLLQTSEKVNTENIIY